MKWLRLPGAPVNRQKIFFHYIENLLCVCSACSFKNDQKWLFIWFSCLSDYRNLYDKLQYGFMHVLIHAHTYISISMRSNHTNFHNRSKVNCNLICHVLNPASKEYANDIRIGLMWQRKWHRLIFNQQTSQKKATKYTTDLINL